MNNEKMIENIRKLCKSANISSSKLEESLGFSKGLISRWKDKTPSLDKIVSIADYFDVSIDELIGRNIEDDHDIFIETVIKMTENGTLTWEEFSENETINKKPAENIFSLSCDHKELYKSDYNNSKIFLIVQYETDEYLISNPFLEIYIQPDKKSNPVLQECDNENEKQNLWLIVRNRFHGIPDEWKAREVREQIINEGKRINV